VPCSSNRSGSRSEPVTDALDCERLIDVPIESLPYVDEHSTEIAATPDEVWEALVTVVSGLSARRGGGALARALGCDQTQLSGKPGRIGSTVPGFVVARSVRPAVLALLGAHRFSRYALIFRLAETPDATVHLGAETRAEFPGAAGRAYRAAVIGTRGHVLATRSMLRAVRRRAERG
jgi:hypothetical protein